MPDRHRDAHTHTLTHKETNRGITRAGAGAGEGAEAERVQVGAARAVNKLMRLLVKQSAVIY